MTTLRLMCVLALLASSTSAWADYIPRPSGATHPARTLVAPFDASDETMVTFHTVRRLRDNGDKGGDGGPIATHWAYWAEDCRHLVDVTVCLTPDDTHVMDVRKVQGSHQVLNENLPRGAQTDLTGFRGSLFVTAYGAELGPSGLDCRADPNDPRDYAISGDWLMANAETRAAGGSAMLGFNGDQVRDVRDADAVRIPTLRPELLGDSLVMAVTVVPDEGVGEFPNELGPRSPRPDNPFLCDVTFVDDLEFRTSFPSVEIPCTGFGSVVSAERARALGVLPRFSLAPLRSQGITAGTFELTRCEPLFPELDERPVYLATWHLQAVDQFGAATTGEVEWPPMWERPIGTGPAAPCFGGCD